ncbi:MAG: GtrA family protein [Turicibacter sp.]
MKQFLNKIQENEKLFQFLKFVIVGGIATVIHYAVYLLLELSFGLQYNIAYTAGYVFSFIFNFFASNYFTFNTKPAADTGVKFAGAHVINYFVHMILLNVFIYIGIPQSFAPILVFPIAIILNFFMVRFALKK